MMDKEQTCQFLRDMGIEFERVDHPAVCNMAEMAKIDLPHPEAEAKNLFLRDDRREHFFLLTVRGDRRVDLKEFRRAPDAAAEIRLGGGAFQPAGADSRRGHAAGRQLFSG